jgi:hypothetical protein
VLASPPPTAREVRGDVRRAAAERHDAAAARGADSAGLAFQLGPEPKVALRYAGDDTFGASIDRAFRLRFVFEGGTAVKAVMQQDGLVTEGPRRR